VLCLSSGLLVQAERVEHESAIEKISQKQKLDEHSEENKCSGDKTTCANDWFQTSMHLKNVEKVKKNLLGEDQEENEVQNEMKNEGTSTEKMFGEHDAKQVSIEDEEQNRKNDFLVEFFKDSADEEEEEEVQDEVNKCQQMFADEEQNIMKCFVGSSIADPVVIKHAVGYYSYTKKKYRQMMEDVASGEALSRIAGDCDGIKDLKFTVGDVGLIKLKARKAASTLVHLMIDILEDPNVDKNIEDTLGNSELARIFEQAKDKIGRVCESGGKTLSEVQIECRDHLNLDAFLRVAMPDGTVQSCSAVQANLLQQHVRLRHQRNHRRAQVVQILHTRDNNLGKYFAAHLRHGGSERNMDLLIADAVTSMNLTQEQRQMLFHVEKDLPREQLTKMCSSWSSLKEAKNLDGAISNSALMQSSVYRSYMDCLCGNELKVICQSVFMRNSQELRNDLEKRQHQLLKKASENQQTKEVVVTEVKESEETNSSVQKVGIGPCLLADAFSCEVCLGAACAPFGSRPYKKGGKNKASDDGPFIVIKNALNAKATDFKISCTACAAVQPGEQISFELEMYAATNFQNLDTMFTNTKIGVDAKTCLGPGSPFRVVFDMIGFTACISNFKAEYLPFLGDLSVEGRIPGPVPATLLVMGFDTAVHDPPQAVKSYCTKPTTFRRCYPRCVWSPYLRCYWSCSTYVANAMDNNCYNKYKNMAGPTTLSGAVAVPLIWGGEFNLAKASGPHSGSPTWKVELFQLPFDQVIQAIKQFWDNTVGPAMQKALNGVGKGVKAVGKWTVGAANAAGKWTVGAAKDVGKFGKAAVKTVISKPAKAAAKWVGKTFKGFR